MKVYTVLEQYCINDSNGSIVKVFETLEKAQLYFERVKKDISTEIEDNDIIEETQNTFEFYESGFYNERHHLLFLEEQSLL